MLLSYDARFAFEIQPNNPEFRYSDHFARFYRALYRCGLPIDIVAPTESLIPYRLVVAPALHIVSEAVAENLACFVRAGGVLVVTMRSGVKDESNAVVSRRLPGLLAPLCGVQVEDYDSLPAGVTNGIEFIAPEFATAQPAVAGVWCDVLQPNGATVVATYTGDYYAGRPALTLNRFGQGWTVYLGTSGDGALYQTLAGWLLRLARLQPMPPAPEGVEMAERWQGDRRLLFVLNHTEREQAVTLDAKYLNLLDGAASLEGRIAIGPRDVLVLQESKE